MDAQLSTKEIMKYKLNPCLLFMTIGVEALVFQAESAQWRYCTLKHYCTYDVLLVI